VSFANAFALVFHSIAPASSLAHQYFVESLARPNMAAVLPSTAKAKGQRVAPFKSRAVPTSSQKDGAMAGRITHMHVTHCCYNFKGWP
jgi:hypothetical protein